MAKGASESAASVAVLALSLEQRFAAGAPFAAELAALSQLGVGADALAPLKPFAESGAPSLSALAASWAKVEPAVAAAAPPPERSGWDRLLDHMRALVRVRRVGEAAGSDESDPPVARIGAALERGDLAAALAAFGQLPEASRAAGAAWADAAKARAGGGQGGVGAARRRDRRPRGGEGLSRREKEFFTSGALSLERRRVAPEFVGHGSPAAVSRPAGARRLRARLAGREPRRRRADLPRRRIRRLADGRDRDRRRPGDRHRARLGRHSLRLPPAVADVARRQGAAAREGLRRALRRHGGGRLGRRAHGDAGSPPKRASISATRR